MDKRNSLRLVLVVLFGLFLASAAPAAKNVVIPTWYGYGLVPSAGGTIDPYIVTPANAYLPPVAYSYVDPYRRFLPYGAGYIPATLAGGWPYYGWGAGAYGTAVSATNLNLRSSPELGGKGNRDFNVIGSLAQGEGVWVFGRTGNWYLVQSMSDPGKYGYAHADYLQVGYPGAAGYGGYAYYGLPVSYATSAHYRGYAPYYYYYPGLYYHYRYWPRY